VGGVAGDQADGRSVSAPPRRLTSRHCIVSCATSRPMSAHRNGFRSPKRPYIRRCLRQPTDLRHARHLRWQDRRVRSDGNFTAGLAQLVAEKGVRVNCVAPGPIWTPLIPSTMPPEHVKSFGKNTPLGRAGQPAELAPAYVLLASDEASYMTGALVPVTGDRPKL
jgi:enoyl-ACP reductase-like protein